jgi:hypothetical protein
MTLTRIGATGQYITTTIDYITDCGAPTSATFSVTVAESAPTLTYSGATAGDYNAITGFEIQYAESTDNSTWGAWTALKTIADTNGSGTTTVNLSGTRGNYRKYRLRTQGAAGSSFYSGWKETASVRYNSRPTAHTAFTATPAIYVSGTITLAYSGATDPDNNIATHNVQYAISDDGVSWGSWVALADGATSHTPTLTAGQYIKYQVRAEDVFGIYCYTWKESNVCGKNTAPNAPTINYPQAGKTIYNSRPRFLLTIGTDPESHLQTLAASGYTMSRSGSLSGSDKVLLRLTSAASAGTVSISAVGTDEYSESSSAATRDTTYAVPSFTDATIVKGQVLIKAAHMTELRTLINTVRAYYGLSAVSWAETITAGVTKTRNWLSHIAEMENAIDDVIALVNGWDTVSATNRITPVTWITPSGGKPQADVMEQIRATIALL